MFEERASGARAGRPVLAEAMDYVRSGDILVVWRLDRLERSLKDLIANVEQLREQGVGFRSLAEAVDTTTAGGQLAFHTFGALAEFQHELIRERTIAGLAAARARGRKCSRPPKMTKGKVR